MPCVPVTLAQSRELAFLFNVASDRHDGNPLVVLAGTEMVQGDEVEVAVVAAGA